jgi:hypothetical protein
VYRGNIWGLLVGDPNDSLGSLELPYNLAQKFF